VFGIVMISYLFAHGSQPATVPCADFGREYDELVAKGEADEGDWDAAWHDVDGRQVEKQRDLLGWDEAPDE